MKFIKKSYNNHPALSILFLILVLFFTVGLVPYANETVFNTFLTAVDSDHDGVISDETWYQNFATETEAQGYITTHETTHNHTAASQAEAEAGTETATRLFSPLRIFQAIAAKVTAMLGVSYDSQADLDAAFNAKLNKTIIDTDGDNSLADENPEFASVKVHGAVYKGQYLVSTIPSTPVESDLITVVDGSTACDITTGGGTYVYGLRYNGTTWDCVGDGGGSGSSAPGGSNTYVQFNDNGLLGGDPGFTYNKNTDVVTLTGGLDVPQTANGPQLAFYREDNDFGYNYVGWGSSVSNDNDLILLHPTADPLSGQIMAFAVPSAVIFADNVSRDAAQGSFIHPNMIVTASKAAAYTIGTDNAAEAYGGVIYVTAAATITAPTVAEGMSFSVITIGNVAVHVDVNAVDRMYLDGVALNDGDKASNTSTTGDAIVCTYESAAGWYCMSGSTDGDHWTDGN